MEFKNGMIIEVDNENYKIVSNKDYIEVPVLKGILFTKFIKEMKLASELVGGYDDMGVYVEGTKVEEDFKGIMMPVNQDDIRLMEAGELAFCNKKIFINENNTLRVCYVKKEDVVDGQLPRS